MKALLALAAPLLLSATPTTGPGTPYYSGMPPVRFRGESIAVVAFVDDVTPYCGSVPAGLVVLACTKTTKEGAPIIFLPNPAPYGNAGDPYAVLVAHELGHTEGWSSNHPR